MFIFSLSPLLSWYKIPFPIGLGSALTLFLSAFIIFKRRFRIVVLPYTFLLVTLYVCVKWTYNNNFEVWTLFPPGGWVFFIFIVSLIGGTIIFDMFSFMKCMKYVVLISAVIFWIQFVIMIIIGKKICFVPNLTGEFIYENMTYSELVIHQFSKPRPCSIFLEPSYMAYYYITYLSTIWFFGNNEYNFFSKEIIFLIITLIALQSGSGMIGLIILIIGKLLHILGDTSNKRRFALILFMIPILLVFIAVYVSSEIGQAMFSRSDEFSTENTSGYTRVVGGFLMFDQLDSKEQWVGISDARERFGVDSVSGRTIFYINGVQTILISLGYIGAILYFVFYACLFSKVKIVSRMCIVILLVMGLLESNYLNPYMMLLTIIPCAEYYMTKKKELT